MPIVLPFLCLFRFCRYRLQLFGQQYHLPEQPWCATLPEEFLACQDTVLRLHSNDLHHAHQSAHRHLQVVFVIFTELPYICQERNNVCLSICQTWNCDKKEDTYSHIIIPYERAIHIHLRQIGMSHFPLKLWTKWTHSFQKRRLPVCIGSCASFIKPSEKK